MEPIVNYTKLSNGMEILGEVNPASRSSALGFFVKTGARDETPEVAGVSHFLEHMMFKGTSSRSALDITYQLGALGAQANAFTSEENTVFYAGVLPENFSACLELFSDMLRPALREEDFSVEKEVILEEIALYRDKPHYYLYENALNRYFNTHSCGNSVLGSRESISALTSLQMKSYFDRRYGAANTCLVACGNINWDKFVADAERLCADWCSAESGRQALPFQGSAGSFSISKKDLQQAQILVVSDGPAAQDPLRYPMAVLALILGDSTGSKLYWKLVHSGLAESACCDQDDRDGVGLVMASASCDLENLEACLKIISETFEAASDFSAEDLELAKKKLCSRIVLNGELSMGRLMNIGIEWSYRKKITPLSELVHQIRSIRRQDIESALKAFPLKIRSEFRLIPEA